MLVYISPNFPCGTKLSSHPLICAANNLGCISNELTHMSFEISRNFWNLVWAHIKWPNISTLLHPQPDVHFCPIMPRFPCLFQVGRMLVDCSNWWRDSWSSGNVCFRLMGHPWSSSTPNIATSICEIELQIALPDSLFKLCILAFTSNLWTLHSPLVWLTQRILQKIYYFVLQAL
jgi:hypothetical protein